MPPAERRALLLLLGLAVAGHAVRHLATRPGEPPGEVQLLTTLSPGSPEAQRDSAMRQARPLGSGETIDIETATVSELARLPRIGLRLAKTIIADREDRGPFGGLGGLDRVPGVGPGLLKIISPHVVFGGAVGQRGGGAVTLATGPTNAAQLTATLTSSPAAPLNLNTATVQQLDSLPGVGRAKAAAIVQYLAEHGPFTKVEELARVPGFGPGALRRLQQHITVR
jgi:competence ComEA-like helix-hairpin-helix protein